MNRRIFFNRKNKYYFFNQNFFLLELVAKKIMKHGKLNQARRVLFSIFKYIKKKYPEKNVYVFFLQALYLAAPRIRKKPLKSSFRDLYVLDISENLLSDGIKNIIYTREDSLLIDSIKIGIFNLLQSAKKRKEKKFFLRLANEIIDTYFGKSESFKFREQFEIDLIKNTNDPFLYEQRKI